MFGYFFMGFVGKNEKSKRQQEAKLFFRWWYELRYQKVEVDITIFYQSALSSQSVKDILGDASMSGTDSDSKTVA